MLPRLVDTWTKDRFEFEAWLTGIGSAIPQLHRRGRYATGPVIRG
jgi:hypothetical protein